MGSMQSHSQLLLHSYLLFDKRIKNDHFRQQPSVVLGCTCSRLLLFVMSGATTTQCSRDPVTSIDKLPAGLPALDSQRNVERAEKIRDAEMEKCAHGP